PKFSDALKSFTRWCLENGEDVEIYAWSGSDYGQISKEMLLKGYKPEITEEKLLTTEWKDFQQEFDRYLGFEKKLSLKQALELAGIGFDGKEHDALDDARNTADLMRTFRDENLFELTLRKVKEALTPTNNSCTLGDFFNFTAVDCA
nr:exonuclease [Eubacterium sp.]